MSTSQHSSEPYQSTFKTLNIAIEILQHEEPDDDIWTPDKYEQLKRSWDNFERDGPGPSHMAFVVANKIARAAVYVALKEISLGEEFFLEVMETVREKLKFVWKLDHLAEDR